MEILDDYEKCRWSKGGKQPLFIKLERSVNDRGRNKRETVWTFPDALKSP